MTFRSRVALVIVWLLSLVIVGAIVSAQTPRRDPAPIVSGADIGFRPEGWRGNKRTGTWMVRINGEWVEAVETVKPAPATTPRD